MVDLAIRRYRPDDAAAIADLSQRYFAPDPAWTLRMAETQLTTDALGGGRQVWVASRGARVVGVAGYVVAPPWLYLWPVAAEDQASAAAVLDAALASGRGPGLTTARVSTRTVEPHKRAAVQTLGFAPSIEFLALARPVAPALSAPVVTATPRRGAAIDRAATHALHDAAFVGVSNSGPTSPDDFAELLDGEDAWPTATAAWHDGDGRCVGFVIGKRAGADGVIEAIGVDAAWRGRGLAQAMLADVIAVAAHDGCAAVVAVIASDNAPSLALHRRAGFVERARKQLWDLAL